MQIERFASTRRIHRQFHRPTQFEAAIDARNRLFKNSSEPLVFCSRATIDPFPNPTHASLGQTTNGPNQYPSTLDNEAARKPLWYNHNAEFIDRLHSRSRTE
jgi:hypothetical protein